MSDGPGAAPAAARTPWRDAFAALRAIVDDFEPRPDQQRMIEAVAAALDARRDLVVEAGTGTGKTLAYLLPILATGRRAILSTATRQLQRQIVEADLPRALSAASTLARVVVLEGRSNYLCHDRVQRLVARGAAHTPATRAALDRVEAALHRSEEGVISAIEGVAEGDPIWAEVTSTRETCLGADCAFVRDCFVLRARRRAQEADVVVVNHHLLLADYALREQHDGAALLPAVDVIVIDEAHALEAAVAGFFGRTVSSRRVEGLLAELRAALEAASVAADQPVRQHLASLAVAAAELFAAARALPPAQPLELALQQALRGPRERLIAALGRLWQSFGAVGTVDPLHERLREALVALEADVLEVLAPRDDAGEVVRWVEARPRSTALRSEPIDVAPILRRTLLAEPATRLLTSATLAVGADFKALTRRLGLDPGVTTLQLAGGFDYAAQALLYVDAALPAPFAPGREVAVADRIVALVEAAGGGAFVLFSSHRQLQEAVARVAPRLRCRVLVQGQEPKGALLERFRRGPPAALLATMGFWQGVDVPGEALRLVILDKIPFPPPDDPRFAARAAALDRQGESSFRALSLPAAAIALRQGFGRLIRRGDDRGVVAILDPRLRSKPYGKLLLAALPPARRCETLDEVRAFFRAGAG